MPKATGAQRFCRKQVGEERGDLPSWLLGCRSKTGMKERAAGGEKGSGGVQWAGQTTVEKKNKNKKK